MPTSTSYKTLFALLPFVVAAAPHIDPAAGRTELARISSASATRHTPQSTKTDSEHGNAYTVVLTRSAEPTPRSSNVSSDATVEPSQLETSDHAPRGSASEPPTVTPAQMLAFVGYEPRREECAREIAAAIAVGFPRHQWSQLEQIAWAESRCIDDDRIHAVNKNRSIDRGSFQINSINVPYLRQIGVIEHADELYDLPVNALAAKAVSDYWGGSLCPWNRGEYCD